MRKKIKMIRDGSKLGNSPIMLKAAFIKESDTIV